MESNEADTRWTPDEPEAGDEGAADADSTPHVGPVVPEGGFEPEVPESDGEPIVGVQPDTVDDVPWDQGDSEPADEEVE